MSSQKTTSDAQSKLLESYKVIEEANLKIKQLEQEVEALKAVKSTNTKDEVQQFRMEQMQKRSQEMELTIKNKDMLSYMRRYCIHYTLDIMQGIGRGQHKNPKIIAVCRNEPRGGPSKTSECT